MYLNLLRQNILKDGHVAIIMGSPQDMPHAKKINEYLNRFGIMTEYRLVSAHKNGEEIVDLAQEYNNSIEPGAVISIAGRSNGLGGALAANLNIPRLRNMFSEMIAEQKEVLWAEDKKLRGR